MHDLLERTKLPLIIVVLVPILAVVYVVFGSSLNAPTSAPAPTTVATQTQSGAPTPPPSTNISLTDPSALPQEVSAAQLVPFSFVVQNPSQESGTYQYKVLVHWSTGEQDVIDENTFTLAPGASQTISEQLKFEVATETAQVSFQLPQTGQSLNVTIPVTQ